MKTVKLDNNRNIREDGYIIQTKNHRGRRAGDIYRPNIAPSQGRRFCHFNGKNHLLARVMWMAFYGPIPSEVHVDHINGDRTDDRLDNLRCLSVRDNNRASKPSLGGSSKYRGVHWNNKRKKWYATIKHNQKPMYIGCYNTEKTAAIARDLKAIELGWPKEGWNFS